MKTARLSVDPGDLKSEASRHAIAQAAEILRGGGTVAFPTETVYGLGANALDATAVAKIFTAKERPSWDPLIVHIGDAAMLGTVVEEIRPEAERLIDAFWPGPLTLLLPRSAQVPAAVTAGLLRVGVRMPAHGVAQALLRAAGVPVAAPSANRFGRTSATTAEHVAEDLNERIDAILDGGETTHGVESTVVDVRESSCVVYRPGVISLEQLRAACRCPVWIREGKTAEETAEAAAAPGMGGRHYAPRARLILVEGEGEAQKTGLGAMVRRCEEAGETVGVMLPDGFQTAVMGRQARAFRWGRWEDQEELAQRLYAGLRWLDGTGVTVIVCPLPADGGVGTALRDRLQKGAKGR
ncbi:MAG TPA: L-threonylcarbamoyladenylate synthase [Acidobacteriaceae bacterium]|nr:L-threonylcarbamoyladenylate synthase [Acidobacteriaceae bacterium]